MVSPVRFKEAATNMLSGPDRPNFLIEISASGALAGAIFKLRRLYQVSVRIFHIAHLALGVLTPENLCLMLLAACSSQVAR